VIFGLTRAGVGFTGPIDAFAAKAAEYGFGAVDASGDELLRWIGEIGADRAAAQLGRLGVRIGSVGLCVDWRNDDASFRETLKRLPAEADAAARLGCTACCTYILPSVDESPARFLALATRRLRIVADVLDAYGLRLGLEFVGPMHLALRWKHPFIRTMAETLDWIAAIDKPNVGLLLDSFHWYTTGGTEADLLSLRPEQIVHVHLNDAPAVPVEQARDDDRLYPGEGVIDLAAFLRALYRIGYRGVVAQEVLRPEMPESDSSSASRRSTAPVDRDPDELFRRSAEAYRRVFAAAGLWPPAAGRRPNNEGGE